ncbi:unnamed protein product [Prorocentrum cordatum]|uniref:FAD/NAD(P)-binding domain-containing protein n=1 Tax=Prorocentrum cordatum TaxID=2364126 RepID=A0ABN9Q2Y8_9DINO|nr:unnamed protein product [Polarella glacialis]
MPAARPSACAVALWMALAGATLASAPPREHHAYCIIGAGPAGLQLGHFLKHAGRDYAVFERSARAGSFFRRYPRHRGLISLNKRRVREGRSAEFALRHDWNSLLDVRAGANRTQPVTERSRDLFPRADVLAEYLVEFSEEQAQQIRYNTTVVRVRRDEDRSGFVLSLALGAAADGNWPPTSSGPDGGEVGCGEVVIATGLWRPRGAKSRIDGAKHLMGYEQLPEIGEAFEGKSVVILGLGNAAMETAQELQKYAAETHLYARSRPLPGTKEKGVRFAYETHYVGDIRAGRTTILDTYLLKSLDTFDYNMFEGATRLVVIPCHASRLCIWQVQEGDCADDRCREAHHAGGQDLSYWVDIARFPANSSLSWQARRLMLEHSAEEVAQWVLEPTTLPEGPLGEPMTVPWEQALATRAKMGIDEEVFETDWEEFRVTTFLLREKPALVDALATLRSEHSLEPVRNPMDHVIRCFGWAMDTSIFDASVPVSTSHAGKYPEITAGWEVRGVPGLYVAGTLTHSLDFRRSAGGFVHGFRYSARALFRLLEEKNHGVAWPSTLIPLDVPTADAGPCAGLDELVLKLRSRINEASGPYQMFQALGDMVVFERHAESGQWTARYMEEVPLDLFEERYHNHSRLTWVFRYAEGFYGKKVLGADRVGATVPEFAEMSNFLHPHLSFKLAGEDEASRNHWLTEDIFTHWEASSYFAPLARFVARTVAAATGIAAFREDGAFSAVPRAGARPDAGRQTAPPTAGEDLPSEPADVERELAALRARQQLLASHLRALRDGGSKEL